MTKVYMSCHTPHAAISAVNSLGAEPVLLAPFGGCDKVTGAHADMQLCVVGGKVIRASKPLPDTYPACAAYNALVLDRYFVHRLDCTAPELLDAAKDAGLELINVRQGYAKCACVVVNGSSIITADRGIAAALEGKVDILLIQSGHILLQGYEYGFIGGASGLIGNTLLFCGDIDRHPDGERIKEFISERRVELMHIPGLDLTDIGSFVQENIN